MDTERYIYWLNHLHSKDRRGMTGKTLQTRPVGKSLVYIHCSLNCDIDPINDIDKDAFICRGMIYMN